MRQIQINRATTSDEPFVAEMMALTTRSLPSLAAKDLAELEGMARLEMSQWQVGRDMAFVAWREEQRAGAVWLHASGELDALHYTVGLAVALRYQRQGIGALLMQHALDYCRTNLGHVISLKVHPTNEAAIRLYRKFGFEVNLLEMKRKI